jgi:hypothetical protein
VVQSGLSSRRDCLGKRATPRLLADGGDAHLEVGLRSFVESKHCHVEAKCSFIETIVQQHIGCSGRAAMPCDKTAEITTQRGIRESLAGPEVSEAFCR